ncbi:MAG: substrate-binding domain-containing protein [Pseudonocardiaceae bacterium]|nr:substrate-binding domain-containing protein [Pseudonocardiaceae bacterium]
MRRSTRVIAGLLTAGVLTLPACGTTSENRGSAGGGQARADACTGPDEDYLIGMSQANLAEPYRVRMNEDIRRAAAKVPQFRVEFADAGQDNSQQVTDVQNFLTKQVDLLIVSPNEAAPLTSVVAKAYNQGTPVILLDRKVNGDAYSTFIGADNVEIGRKAGEYIAQTLLPQGGNVVEIRGLPGSTPAQERGEGFRQGIEGSQVQIVDSQAADWLREKGRETMDAILKSQPKIDVLFSHNDPMAEGAYLAAEAAGRAGGMEFVGIDALPIPSGGIKAVEQGRLSATFVYPTGGPEAIEAAKKLLITCQDVPKTQILQTELITERNATEVYNRENSQG